MNNIRFNTSGLIQDCLYLRISKKAVPYGLQHRKLADVTSSKTRACSARLPCRNINKS